MKTTTESIKNAATIEAAWVLVDKFEEEEQFHGESIVDTLEAANMDLRDGSVDMSDMPEFKEALKAMAALKRAVKKKSDAGNRHHEALEAAAQKREDQEAAQAA